MKICVVSPKCTSSSARYIVKELNAAYENPFKTGRFDFTKYDAVINWGCSSVIGAQKVLNHPDYVRKAVDKIETFKLLDGRTNIVPWTQDPNIAVSWKSIVARKFREGNRSKGIDFISDDNLDLLKTQKYKFFTKYIDHIGEFRINVFKGKIVSLLEKEVASNGNFSFKLIYGEPIDELVDMCKAVDKELGLDFYGLDVVFDDDNRPILLEVNSAPMLFGTTGIKFINHFKKELGLV